jgi:hypothetical protein
VTSNSNSSGPARHFESECEQLRAENARLIALLEQHSIPHQDTVAVPPEVPPTLEPVPSVSLSSAEKIALFRRRFSGRTDVYPIRWESKTGRSGYAPACGNEWRVGVCEKPRIKCADCGKRLLLSLTDQVIYEHLAGKHVAFQIKTRYRKEVSVISLHCRCRKGPENMVTAYSSMTIFYPMKTNGRIWHRWRRCR